MFEIISRKSADDFYDDLNQSVREDGMHLGLPHASPRCGDTLSFRLIPVVIGFR